MITNQSFICFGEDLGQNPFSRYHFMKHLASKNKVLYVESIGVRSPQVSARDVSRVIAKIRRWLRGCREVAPNFYAFSPVAIPLHHNSYIGKLNEFLLKTQIQLWSRKLGVINPILWLGLPTAGPLIGKLGEQLVVYHCADKLTAYVSDDERLFVTALHAKCLAQADITLTPSKLFYQELQQQTKNCYQVPHGVDYEHFAQAQEDNLLIPQDIASLPRPIIGFFGTIDNHWVDFSLLAEAAQVKPNWSFVLIGPVYHSSETDQVKKQPNIYFLGPRPYTELPAYAKAFSVCMIPKKQSELTAASSPLKLREYLATGKPVVTTLEPEVPYKNHVNIAHTVSEFVSAIEVALSQDTLDHCQARMALVKQDSWKNRVETLSEILEDALNQTISAKENSPEQLRMVKSTS